MAVIQTKIPQTEVKAVYSGGAKVKYNDTKSMGSMAFGDT